MVSVTSHVLLAAVMSVGVTHLAPSAVEWRSYVLPADEEIRASSVARLLEAVLDAASHSSYSIVFLTDGTTSASTLFTITDHQRIPGGVGVFEAAVASQDANTTVTQLSSLIPHVKRLRQVTSHTTFVVISDDVAFLAAFVDFSLDGRLLVWSTRFLVVTSLPLLQLQVHSTVFSKMNAMLLVISDDLTSFRCNMYVQLPFTPRGTKPLWLGFWTPRRGLVLTTHLPLFPDKFSKFLHKPHLLAASEGNPFHRMIVSDAGSPGGPRYHFSGPMADLLDYLAQALNFSYSKVRPPDGVWGAKLDNGSWSGMVGMVIREEASIGVGPFILSGERAKVVDFTAPIFLDYWKIMGARGVPEVDPWGFLFPLTPLVWAATLAALLLLAAVVFLVFSCSSLRRDDRRTWLQVTFDYIRIFLQQDITVPAYWWWERVMLMVWMLMTLVITRSYSGNLMALLAVRHISQPYQSRRQVLDDPSVTMIWLKGSGLENYLQSAESGIYREMANVEKMGRLMWIAQAQFVAAIDTLVRQGDHILIEVDNAQKAFVAQDYTRTGECSFYSSKEGFMPLIFGMIGPMDNPIVPAVNKRIMTMTEAGLFFQWMKTADPNLTMCLYAPSKITVKTPLSLNDVWGMFVMVFAGLTLSVSALGLEILTSSIQGN
nr:probable glutamate receptor [Cherax quadricarinatus]